MERSEATVEVKRADTFDCIPPTYRQRKQSARRKSKILKSKKIQTDWSFDTQ